MNKVRIMKTILLVGSLFWLIGCASGQAPIEKSDFLKAYNNFKPNPQHEGAWFSTSEHFNLTQFRAYDKIAFAPISLWLSKDKPYQIKDVEKQKAVTRYFENVVREKIKNSKQIVPPGTKDSLLIKMAFTYVGERSPEFEALDVLPFRIVINGGKMAYLAATGQKIVAGEATLEVEFVDTNTNTGLVSTIIESTTDEIYVEDDANNIDTAKAIINQWATRLHEALGNKAALQNIGENSSS